MPTSCRRFGRATRTRRHASSIGSHALGGGVVSGPSRLDRLSAAQSDVEDRVRTITQLDISERYDARAHDSLIEITVTANGFLRYMVRTIAGTLMAIARNELTADDFREAIVKPTPPCPPPLLLQVV